MTVSPLKSLVVVSYNDNLRTHNNHQEHQTQRPCYMRFNLCNGYRMAIHSTIGRQTMHITISYYDLIEAIQSHLETKNICIDLEKDCSEIDISINEQNFEPKKHKNGRVVKDEDGHTVFEYKGSKEKHYALGGNDEISIFLE